MKNKIFTIKIIFKITMIFLMLLCYGCNWNINPGLNPEIIPSINDFSPSISPTLPRGTETKTTNSTPILTSTPTIIEKPKSTQPANNWNGTLAVGAYEINQSNKGNALPFIINSTDLSLVNLFDHRLVDYPFSWSSDGNSFVFTSTSNVNNDNPFEYSKMYVLNYPTLITNVKPQYIENLKKVSQ